MQESPQGGPLTVDDAVEKYLKLTAHIKTGTTRNGEAPLIRESFRYFKDEFGITQFQRITERHVLSYRDRLIERVAKRELKAISANNKLKHLKKVFRWYKKRKEFFFNPASDIDPVPVQRAERSRSVTLTTHDVQRIVEAPYEVKSGFNIKTFVILLYATGMRLGEALHLEWSDIDWEKKLIRLRHKPHCPTKYGMGWKPKWGKERDVYLNDTALMVLKRLPRVESVGFIQGDRTAHPAHFVFVTKDRKLGRLGDVPWQRIDDVRSSWRELMKAAGLWKPNPQKSERAGCPFIRHDLRRSWSAHAKDSASFTVDEASAVLGHDPSANVQHYSGVGNAEQIREKVQRHPSNTLDASRCYPIVTKAEKQG